MREIIVKLIKDLGFGKVKPNLPTTFKQSREDLEITKSEVFGIKANYFTGEIEVNNFKDYYESDEVILGYIRDEIYNLITITKMEYNEKLMELKQDLDKTQIEEIFYKVLQHRAYIKYENNLDTIYYGNDVTEFIKLYGIPYSYIINIAVVSILTWLHNDKRLEEGGWLV